MPKSTILAIETSCDETAAAVVEGSAEGQVIRDVRIRSNVVASQAATHQRYGGVFPEIAAREHVGAITSTIEAALRSAFPHQPLTTPLCPDQNRDFEGQANHQSLFSHIDAIAVTVGPGLIGSLLIGVEAAQALAMSFKLPIIGVNHLDGHFFSTFIPAPPEFPVVALIASGGHTMLVWASSPWRRTPLGTTRDDAVGEAFDKVAKLLGLGYPGGPQIEELAGRSTKNPLMFPTTLLNDCSFSYSGLKTAVRQFVEAQPRPIPEHIKAQIAAGFQHAAFEQIVGQTLRVVATRKSATVVVGGGVALNKVLHTKLRKALPGVTIRFPQPALTGDNAAMIGVAALWQQLRTKPVRRYALEAQADLKLML